MQRNACKAMIRNADGSTKSVMSLAQASAQTWVQGEADAVRKLEGIGLVVVMIDARQRALITPALAWTRRAPSGDRHQSLQTRARGWRLRRR